MVIYAEDLRDGFGEEKRKRRNKVFTPLKFNVDSFPA